LVTNGYIKCSTPHGINRQRQRQQAIIVPLWKNKGSKKDCTKYRGISILSHVGKLYEKLFESRMRPVNYNFQNNKCVLEEIEAVQMQMHLASRK
jgi:hypothetical protein